MSRFLLCMKDMFWNSEVRLAGRIDPVTLGIQFVWFLLFFEPNQPNKPDRLNNSF